MPVSLPTNQDGTLRSFTGAEVEAFDLKRRGVNSAHDHVQYRMGPNGNSCTRKFSCAWDQRFNVAIYLAGAVKSHTVGSETTLLRLLPQTDPDIPGWRCSQVDIDPWRFMSNTRAPDAEGDSPELNNPGYNRKMHVPVFDRAELRVTFEQLPWDLKTDAEIGTELDRFVTKPGQVGCDISSDTSYIGPGGAAGFLKYVTADGTSAPKGIPIPYGVGFCESVSKLSCIWRRVPPEIYGPGRPLTQRVEGTPLTRPYKGAINRTSFMGYEPLTLQLIGCEPRLLPDPTGLGELWDIRYIFQHRPTYQGWLGYFFHSVKAAEGNPGYYQTLRVTVPGNTVKAPADIGDQDALFVVRDFHDLFVPGELT